MEASNQKAIEYLNSIGVKYQVRGNKIRVNKMDLRVSQYRELLHIFNDHSHTSYSDIEYLDKVTIDEFSRTFAEVEKMNDSKFEDLDQDYGRFKSNFEVTRKKDE